MPLLWESGESFPGAGTTGGVCVCSYRCAVYIGGDMSFKSRHSALFRSWMPAALLLYFVINFIVCRFYVSEESFAEPRQDSMKGIWIPVGGRVLAWSTALKFNGQSYRIMREEGGKNPHQVNCGVIFKGYWVDFYHTTKKHESSPSPPFWFISTAIVCLLNGKKGCKVGESFVCLSMCAVLCGGRGTSSSEKHTVAVWYERV